MPPLGTKKERVNKKTGKPLNKFKLLAGGHEQADPEWTPTEEEIEEAKARGTTPRAPTKSYRAGDTVYSDKDLVHLCGANKFQLLGAPREAKGNLEEGIMGDPTPQNLESGLTYPNGQVNTGFQQTGGVDELDQPTSGIISREELVERGLLPDPPPDKSEKLKKQREEAGGSFEEEEGEDGPVRKKKKAGKVATGSGGHATKHAQQGQIGAHTHKGTTKSSDKD